VLIFHGPSEYDDFPCAARQNRKPLLGRDNVCECPKHSAQSPDFHPQPRAIGLIDTFRTECSHYEGLPRHISRPRFGEQPRKRE
jgi:hypothetical protein